MQLLTLGMKVIFQSQLCNWVFKYFIRHVPGWPACVCVDLIFFFFFFLMLLSGGSYWHQRFQAQVWAVWCPVHQCHTSEGSCDQQAPWWLQLHMPHMWHGLQTLVYLRQTQTGCPRRRYTICLSGTFRKGSFKVLCFVQYWVLIDPIKECEPNVVQPVLAWLPS